MKWRSLAIAGGVAAALGVAIAATLAPIPEAQARSEVRIVGSSTVFPFSSRVAEEYKNKTGNNVVIESTGSGGGHKRFCEGLGPNTPDITNSSRRQLRSEFELCQEAGVTEIVEIKMGYDGIVVANARGSADFDLTERQIYLAVAAKVPTSDDDCTLIDNPYTNWSQIDASLPDQPIEAYGPPPTSGTRDAFVELAMEAGARDFACLSDLRRADPEDADYADALAAVPGLEEGWLNDRDGNPRRGRELFQEIAHKLREDGRWIDSGENDNAIVATLVRTPEAVGIFGYSFLDQNRNRIKAATVNGVEPDLDSVAAGDYPIARSLYFYVKKAHADGSVADVPAEAIRGYLEEFTSEAAWGAGGYLERLGLVPLPEDLREEFGAAARELETYER